MSERNKKYIIFTYGCQMNVHDSEKLAGMLVKLGYSETADVKEADIAVFNTCCIRDNAEHRAIGNIGALKKQKEKNRDMIIAVVGCMTQQDGAAEDLIKKLPFIDIVLGTANTHLLEENIIKVLNSKQKKRLKVCDTFMPKMPEVNEAVLPYRTSGCNAWVNIVYGCNNFCTYCIVPYVRGRERSREPEMIISEIKLLLASGYKEITLLGQNVNSYGSDRSDGWNFAKLLKEIAKIDTKFRLRFMTSHPKDLTQEVVEIMATSKNFMPYIHLPVQSGSTKVLRDMNRKYTKEHYIGLIEMIRSIIPNCGITTDIMVGFPTETEEDAQETADLMKIGQFGSAFTFVYSPRKGTPAADMVQLSDEVKIARIQKLIEIQQEITQKQSESLIGSVCEVLCENISKNGKIAGRSEQGRLVECDGSASIGDFVNVKITGAGLSKLRGVII
ncbi:MAG: tRNA (N6-isopentenyl adenosine(37)-C2)-methylthiotransferase MiaB [Bacillota bacterium]